MTQKTPKQKKTKLQWVREKDSQIYVSDISCIGWSFILDGEGLKGKFIPCVRYRDSKEEIECCLSFKLETLSAAKQICQKMFDKHVKQIIKNFG